MPRFSIIIVTWNALRHLKTFLPSVAHSRHDNFEIILADNASTDASAKWVREQYPKVKIVSFDQNHGYCGGNNRAVPYAEGDILIFLNNDVQVDPQWLKPLDELFSSDPEVAAVQPKMRSYKNSEMFEYAGAAGGCIDRYGYPFCRGRIFDTLEKDEGQYDNTTDIFWASGAAMAIRKNVFQKMGGFDEDFEFHMEEIDLCWRLWDQGYRVEACPNSLVYHLGGGSLPTQSPRKVYYNYRNSLVMLWKNYPASALLTHFPVRLILDKIAALRELLNGRTDNFKAIVKAHWYFWSTLPKTYAKRKKLKKIKTNNRGFGQISGLSIIWQYFIKGVKKFSDLPL